jgi:phosphatidylethanolamine-binding protein (PEBP) family uncharacterized protein
MRRMRQGNRVFGGALLAGLVLAGGGGLAAASGGARARASKVPLVNLTLASSTGLEPIAARYTCDGADQSLPLSWGRIPYGTVELAVFIINSEPVHGKFFVDWAVTGLKPSLRKLSPGQLPAGAVVGRNSFGQARYSICPPRGARAGYLIRLDALPKRVGERPGFNAPVQLTPVIRASSFSGLLGFSYKRR